MKKRFFGKLYKELFYIPKDEKLPEKVFLCRLAVYIVTILACIVAMATSTFAWFFSEVSTDNSTIASAHYSITVDNTENGIYICPLAFGDKYTFEIKADGTATKGYCKIQVGEKIYYTEQIPKGSSLTLTIQAAKGTRIIFTPGWGISAEDACGKEIIHSETPYATYTVEKNAKLADIAAHYKVSQADILTYNGITEISENMKLKIPGVSPNAKPYVVPVPETPKVEEPVTGGDTDEEQQPTQDAPSEEPTEKPTEEPTTDETPAEDTAPTEEAPTTEEPTVETPAPDETTPGGEDNGGEQPTEEPTEQPTEEPTTDETSAEDTTST